MADFNLTAQQRTEFGKGASRRVRRAGLTPAVLYGHGGDPIHLTVDAHELFLAMRTANALFELTIDGEEKPVLALPRQVQRNPIRPEIDHVDFLLVREGEKVAVEVPLVQTGEVERGSIINTELTSLPVFAPATNIPTEFIVSVEGLVIGDNIFVSDIELPEGIEADIDLEEVVLSVLAPSIEEEPEEDEEVEDEGDEEAAEEE